MKDKKELVGILDITKNGHAYLITESEDLFINKNNLSTALDGDEVVVNVIPSNSSKDNYIQGVVSKVNKRSRTEFSGVIEISKEKGFAFVRTAGGKMPVDFYVPIDMLNGATDGDVVIVKLNRWYKKDKSPRGIVKKILGKAETHETEMSLIMNKHNIDYTFPEEVIAEANAIPVEITESEILKRRDMRDVLTLTIDGSDAKDLDDALSFIVLDNGNYEIGVHIADVGHYVKNGGKIDAEALNRGTSIYLVDRCLPMLPEKLSNNLASLNPNTDKLTVSIVFEITPEGEVKKHKFKKTVINSNYRLTYDTVQEIIEKGYAKKLEIINDEPPISNLIDAIVKLNYVAKKMRDRRFKDGAVSFNSKEPRFILDENNIPIDVCFNELKDSNKLIEEYMLLANRSVGTFLYENKIPAAFRVHDSPDEERLKELSVFAKQFGYELNITGNIKSVKESLNQLLNNIKETPEENMISTLAVRCMEKAICSPINIGHYGLGDNFMPPNAYAWFTSGIRRYADVINQRQLFDFLEGKKNEFKALSTFSSYLIIKSLILFS